MTQQVVPYAIASAAIEEEPVTSYAQVLCAQSKDDLTALARELELKGYSKLNKAELADAIARACSVENPDACLKTATYCSPEQYRAFRLALDHGGSVSFTPAELEHRIDLEPHHALVNVYLWDGTYTFVVYDETAAVFKDVDWSELEAQRAIVQDELQAIAVSTAFCGLVLPEDVCKLCAQWYGHEVDVDSLLFDAMLSGEIGEVDFELTTIGDELYFEDLALAEESERLEDPESIELFEGYLAHLVELHKATPMRTFAPELREQDPYDWKLALPGIVRLQAFLDANAPQEGVPKFWAEDVAASFAFDPLISSNVADQVEMLTEAGLDPRAAGSPELRAILTALNDELPQWENNGWSNRELRELQTGKKAFFNEDGTEQKVGRNDPCPCGSGKKYKKCCGR